MWWIIWSGVCIAMAMMYWDSLAPVLPDWMKPAEQRGDLSRSKEGWLPDGLTNINGWKVRRQGYDYELSRETEKAIQRRNGNMPVELMLVCREGQWFGAVAEANLGAAPVVSTSSGNLRLEWNGKGYVGQLSQQEVSSFTKAREINATFAAGRGRVDASSLEAVLSRLPPCLKLTLPEQVPVN